MIRTPALAGALLGALLLAVPAEVALGQEQPAEGMMGQGPMGPAATMPPGGGMGFGHMRPGMTGPGMMGYGQMGPGHMGHGHMEYGHMHPGHMGHGHMGHGHMGYGHMHPGHMGPGMMGLGMMGCGRMGAGWREPEPLGVDDVRALLERHLAWHGNPRLKLGEVKEADDATIMAEIVTQDDSLVQRLAVDRRTGWMRQAE